MRQPTVTGRLLPRRGEQAPTRTRPVPAAGRSRLTLPWLAAGIGAVLLAMLAGLALGPVQISPVGIVRELLGLSGGLSDTDAEIIRRIRLPRVVLGLVVGAMLALTGGCYQGVFRNPLADPYLLGVAAGAGLGATGAIAVRASGGAVPAGTSLAVPLAAFTGALVAVALTYGVGVLGAPDRSPAALILAGVAVTALLTALQTYLLQRNVDTIREVYSWLLGQLATDGWGDVRLVTPFAVLTAAVILAYRRELDVLAVGDEEAASLGAHPRRTRYILIIAASLGTAAAVSVSGLIGFVGLVVPHAVRLLAGGSYRIILPLSMLFGAAFLTLADLAARTVLKTGEMPIGVVTAFVGAPFFIVVLRTARRL